MDLADLGLRHQASKFLSTRPPPVTPLQALEHPAPVTVLVCKVKRARFQEWGLWGRCGCTDNSSVSRSSQKTACQKTGMSSPELE